MSETRQQSARLEIRCLPEALERLKAEARELGVPYTALARRRVFGDELAAAMPSAPPPPPEHAAQLRRLLGHLGKARSNVEQIARYRMADAALELGRMRIDVGICRELLVDALSTSQPLDLARLGLLVERLAELSGRLNLAAKATNEQRGGWVDLREHSLAFTQFRAELRAFLAP